MAPKLAIYLQADTRNRLEIRVRRFLLLNYSDQ